MILGSRCQTQDYVRSHHEPLILWILLLPVEKPTTHEKQAQEQERPAIVHIEATDEGPREWDAQPEEEQSKPLGLISSNSLLGIPQDSVQLGYCVLNLLDAVPVLLDL